MIATLWALAFSFGKIGLISLGGGNSMLKLIETESVDFRHWVGPDEFVAMVGSTFLFPGLTAVKLSALIGYKVAGMLGLLVSVFAINIPGLLFSIVGYRLLSNPHSPIAKKIMVAVQYGALALLAAASFSVGQGVVVHYFSWLLSGFAILFFIGLAFFSLSPFWGFLVFILIGFFLVR